MQREIYVETKLRKQKRGQGIAKNMPMGFKNNSGAMTASRLINTCIGFFN
jgi:hypothetical protein